MSQPADGSCGTFGVTLRRFSAESKHDTHTIKSFSPPAHFPLIPELSFPWIWVWIRFRFRAVCCGPSCELLVEFFLVLFFFLFTLFRRAFLRAWIAPDYAYITSSSSKWVCAQVALVWAAFNLHHWLLFSGEKPLLLAAAEKPSPWLVAWVGASKFYANI